MSRYITITLDKRGVSCVARLLDAEAPRTAAAVWEALPLSGAAYHAKYARNEIYTLVPPFAAGTGGTGPGGGEPGPENPTVTPIPGDVCYFEFQPWQIGNTAYGYDAESQAHSPQPTIDLAIFYGRNNLLINGDQGWIPGNVFATIEQGLPEMAAAAQDMWLRGVEGETLSFRRHNT